MKHLTEFWSYVNTDDQIEQSVLKLLKQGKTEYKIKEKLKLTGEEWKKTRKSLLSKINMLTQTRGLTIRILPDEKSAKNFLLELKSLIIVAYTTTDFPNVNDVDPYLTHLERRGFEVLEISQCENDETKLTSRFDQLNLVDTDFVLILGDSFFTLHREIKRDGERKQQKKSSTYQHFLDEGLLQGKAYSLQDQIAWFEKNSSVLETFTS